MFEPLFRYQKLIASMLPPIGEVRAVMDDDRIPIDLGIAGPIVALPRWRFVITDAHGHSRSVYRPLLICSWLRLPTAREHQGVLREWIDTLDDGVWSWLARARAGELFGIEKWRGGAAAVFGQLAANQQVSGALLPADNSANPETRWYEELLLLHALASYAAMHPSSALDRAVQKAARFHLEETQPDHASAQPWGLLAFVQYAQPLADQVLHAMMMQYPGGVSGVPLLLLADVLYGLDLLLDRTSPDGLLQAIRVSSSKE
jgi:hypothetical protein